MDSADLAWLERYGDLGLSTKERKALVYARKTGASTMPPTVASTTPTR